MFCSFGGKKYLTGQAVLGYQNSSVPAGQKCVSEVRTCLPSGNLSGTFSYDTCTPGAAASCVYGTNTIPDGVGFTAYPTSTVGVGMKCIPEVRKCSNGVLSGSATYSKCDVNAPHSCLFNNETVASGMTKYAFQSSAVPYGQVCQSKTIKCYDGVWSDDYKFPSCTPGAPATCNFHGQIVAHGQSVPAFASSSVPFGSSCVSQLRTCMNGVLTGTNDAPSCVVQPATPPSPCKFGSDTIASGDYAKAYRQASVPYGSTCIVESRQCVNGVLGEPSAATNVSCVVLPAPPPAPLPTPPPTPSPIPTPTPTVPPVTCNQDEIILAKKSYVETITVEESKVISNCIDSANLTYQSNDPSQSDWNFIRFFNTCGNRYCGTLDSNYIDGRVTERNNGQVILECRRRVPTPVVSDSCKQRLQTLPDAIAVRSVSEVTVGLACIDDNNKSLDENSMHYDNAHSIRFMYNCGSKWCRSNGFATGRVVENNNGNLIVNCFNQEVFDSLQPGTISFNKTNILEISKNCKDGVILGDTDSFPSRSIPNQVRFVNTCGNRYCRNMGLGESGGWIVEMLANTTGDEGRTVATVMCMK
jgi:hypothetical protein